MPGRAAVLDLSWERSQGHPHIIQFVGEQLVRTLNERSPDQRAIVDLSTIEQTLNGVDFARHYVTTYWGQARPLERVITALLCRGATTLPEIRRLLYDLDIAIEAASIDAALRMIDLYGIVERVEEPLELRARWLPEALDAFGGAEAVAADWAARVVHPPVAVVRICPPFMPAAAAPTLTDVLRKPHMRTRRQLDRAPCSTAARKDERTGPSSRSPR